MKSAIKWLVLLAAVVAGAGFIIKRYHDRDLASAYELELKDVKRSFQRRAVGLALIDGEAYRREIGTTLTDYFGKLDELRKKYPGIQDVERERKKTIDDQLAGRLKEGQKEQREERIDLALGLFEKMRTGQYRPLYTAADKTFRFDIYELGPVKTGGETNVRLAFVHWGAFGPLSYNTIEGNLTAPKPEKGKPIELQKIVGDGQPPVLQFEPDRWVSEFIPNVEVGYYELPLFPREATAVTLTFAYTIQSPGGTHVPVNIAFPEMPLPESWKIPVGQKWDAEVQTMSPEEVEAAAAKSAQK